MYIYVCYLTKKTKYCKYTFAREVRHFPVYPTHMLQDINLWHLDLTELTDLFLAEVKTGLETSREELPQVPLVHWLCFLQLDISVEAVP